MVTERLRWRTVLCVGSLTLGVIGLRTAVAAQAMEAPTGQHPRPAPTTTTPPGTSTDDFLNLFPTVDDTTGGYLMDRRDHLPSTGTRDVITVVGAVLLTAGAGLRRVSVGRERREFGKS